MNLTQQRVALAIVSTIVSACLAGVGWWWLAGRGSGVSPPPGAGFAAVESLGFLLDPSRTRRHATAEFDVEVSTNALGLRGPEVVVPKPPGRYRILALGDSFTFGWGAEFDDAWVARVARGLQATDGRAVELVVAGVPGWSPPQEFVFLEQRGLDLQPDLVLWQLCSNDLLEMERLELELDERRLPVAVRAEPPLTAGLREDWLQRFKMLDDDKQARVLSQYRAGRIDPLLRQIMWSADLARREQAGEVPAGDVAGLAVEDVLRGLRSGPEFGLRYVEHLVSAARELCAARGIGLRLMLAQSRKSAQAGAEPDYGTAQLSAWAARQSPRVLDSNDVLGDEPTERAYFVKDPHWAPAAQPLVADAVTRWLAADTALGLSLVAGR